MLSGLNACRRLEIDVGIIVNKESETKDMEQLKKAGDGPTGLIFDIKKYAIHDGPGIRTTVFFKGCPLRCKWCHNPESWSDESEHSLRITRCVSCGECVSACNNDAIVLTGEGPVTNLQKCTLCGKCVQACVFGARELIGRRVTVDEVMAEIEKDIVFYDQSGGGVTLSGGEPFAQPEFLSEILKRCKNCGIHTALDTTCHVEQNVLETVVQDVDLFLCDIKHMDSETHERFTGVGNELILDNIKWLSSLNSAIVIRFPVIAVFNDDAGNIRQMAEFISSLVNVNRVDILPYNPGGLEKSARFCAEYDIMESEIVAEAKLEQIADKLREFAIDVKIGG